MILLQKINTRLYSNYLAIICRIIFFCLIILTTNPTLAENKSYILTENGQFATIDNKQKEISYIGQHVESAEVKSYINSSHWDLLR